MTPIQWHRKRVKAEMPNVAEVMLDIINNHKVINVTNLVNEAEKESIGSRAHLHFNLSWLREHSYVKAISPVDNLRVKELSITAKGLRYLEINHE